MVIASKCPIVPIVPIVPLRAALGGVGTMGGIFFPLNLAKLPHGPTMNCALHDLDATHAYPRRRGP